MRKILFAADSFKESLSSQAVNEIMAKAARDVFPNIITTLIAISDGGEGFSEAFLSAHGGQRITVAVHDPLNRTVCARYSLLADKTAVIELAEASGLALLKPDERNPLLTTTYGTGQLISHALDMGCQKIILGLGGSATNDGGIGLAAALGIHFKTENGQTALCGQDLCKITAVDTHLVHPKLNNCPIQIACDISNPFFGEQGAAYIFSPQKGASPEQVILLDQGLRHLAEVIHLNTGVDVHTLPGSGAAGGAAAPLVAYAHAKLSRGLDLLLDSCDFDAALAGCDLVITGEGASDVQSAMGKAPGGIARRAAAQGIPVIVLSGSIRPGSEALFQQGVSALFPAVRGVSTLSEALSSASENVYQTALNIFRLIKALEEKGSIVG
jgi:glycerate kinase